MRGETLLARMRGKICAGDWVPVIYRLPAGGHYVGFSFDDGPTQETTPPLIDLLRAYDATATFFLNGERAAAAPGLVSDLVAAGHDVFPHGWFHVRHDTLTADELIAGMERTECVLRQFRAPPSPYLVRLPYGAGHMTPRVHRALRSWRRDVQVAHWFHDTRDWTLADGCADVAALRASSLHLAETILAHDDLAGAVLLMHETPLDVTAPLAAAAPPIFAAALLEEMRKRGLRARGVAPRPRPPLFRRVVRG